MPSDTLVQIAVIFFAMACIGGVAWVFLLPRLDGSANAAKRVQRISTRTPGSVAAASRERDGVWGGATEKERRRIIRQRRRAS